MENTQFKNRNRYEWVDNIKLACCILVVLGHFYQSMIASEIIKGSLFYSFSIQTMYTFHVPLFFVCSGFLYQKSNKVHNLKSWSKNVSDKLLNLGVPYFTFTLITLVIKKIFSDSVNNPADDFFKTLFINPTAPYWYLYALFFLFLFIPCLKTKKQAVLLFTFSFFARILYLTCSYNSIQLPYILSSTFSSMIWFIIGMCLAFDMFDLTSILSKIIMMVTGITALVLSIYFYREENLDLNIQYIIGLLFVISIIILSQNLQFKSVNKISFKFREYFMPVYVMHTIAAAGVRILLLKLNIQAPFIHIVLGILAGFVLPVIAYEIAKRIHVLLFFIYPKKAIFAIKQRREITHE